MVDQPTLQFLGAAGTVTGSKHLVRVGGRQVLLDCGMFQGLKRYRDRNWRPLPFKARDIDAVVLSHAHIDHSGHLPLIVRDGFRGPVYCTPGTADLLRFLLPDAAYLQEEQAAHANRHRYSKHRPALPLYTMEDAQATLRLVQPRPYIAPFDVTPHVSATLRPAGHILGSASIDIELDGPDVNRLVFSGDLGRWGRPILPDPAFVPSADLLLLESTYGDRDHPATPEDELAQIVRDAAARGGPLLVPAFAVGRTQELLWRLRELEDDGCIPSLPVYVDSPMAINVTSVYLDHPEDHDLDMQRLTDSGDDPLQPTQFQIARTVAQSKALNDLNGPVIIISASGMATGGRILHHMKRWLPDKRTTVLLVGYQAAGTRGRTLQDGAREVRIHGREITRRATVETIRGLSAHADRGDLLRWLQGFDKPPERIFLVHGEERAASALATTLRDMRPWQIEVAADGETVSL